MTRECTDKHFKDLLHHYELGMLSAEQRREFELHLMECEYCFQRADRFRRVANLMNNDPGVRSLISEIDESDVRVSRPIRSASSRPRRRGILIVPASLVAAAVFVFLILQPWSIRDLPTDELHAQPNLLAVMYINNIAQPDDPQRWGEMLTHLLITDLSESHYFGVVSSQHLYDVLRLLGKAGEKKIDPSTATEAATRVGARWMLTGSILQVEPQWIITVQITETVSGELAGSFRVVCDGSDNIFAVVDDLTRRTRAELDLPLSARQERDPQVAEVTTHSPEAYRHFVKGTEQMARVFKDSAIVSFEKALDYDSTFAMAYYYLAGLKDPALITRAVEYQNNASQRDRYFIRSRAALVSGNLVEAAEILDELVRIYPQEKEAWYTLAAVDQRLGRQQDAIAHYERAISIDPLFKRAYNALAYLYDQAGEADRALWAINHYIELAPEEPNPWDTRGELLARNGQLDEAIASFRRALEISPAFLHSLHYLGLMYLFQGDYTRADSCQAALANVPGSPLAAASSLYRCLTPMMQGRFGYAVNKIDSTIRANCPTTEGKASQDLYEYLRTLQTLAYWQLGELDSALVALEAGQRHADSCNYTCGQDRRHLYVQLLALDGRTEDAEAMVNQLRAQLRTPGAEQFTYWYAAGALAMSRENYNDAIVNFETAADITDRFEVRYWLARTYLEAGRTDDAIELLQNLMQTYDSPRSYFAPWSVRLHYDLGRAFEASRRYDQASEEYLAFLDIWKEADPGLPLVDSARTALSRVDGKP